MDAIIFINFVLVWVIILCNIILTLAVIRRLNSMSQPTNSSLKSELKEGEPAPDFIAETLAGEKASLSTYEGRPVAFLFVAPTCQPCRESMPKYKEAYSSAQKAGVEIVLVSIAGAEQTRTFVDEMGINMPVLVAPFESNSFMKDYKVTATPRFCMIGADGKIKAAGYPSLEWGGWKKLLDAWAVADSEANRLALTGRR
jgi:peroxiredoxin